MGPSNAVERLLSVPLMLAFSASLHAGTFECTDVAADAEGHQHVFQYLSEQQGIEPVELAYCDHPQYPRWRARWAPFEAFEYRGENWRRYATASCSDRGERFVCHMTEHVILGASHVVVDIEQCDISIATIAALQDSVMDHYPGHEMTQVDVVVVEDGGAWSPADYGYSVRLLAPPEFAGGSIRRFTEHCDGAACTWNDVGKEATWMSGSSGLRRLRRERDDPLIEYMTP